jgi:hypothetical protein
MFLDRIQNKGSAVSHQLWSFSIPFLHPMLISRLFGDHWDNLEIEIRNMGSVQTKREPKPALLFKILD